MKTDKIIPFKNYIILSIVLILSIILVIYFYMWYSEIEKNNIGMPIMDEYLNVINFNEISDYLIENKDVVLYVSVLDNDNTKKFEKKFKKVIYNYSLNNSMLYLNLTDENSKIIDSFMKDNNINSLPCIIKFRNGRVISVYNISDRNYDIDLLISYLRIEEIIND